jgi:hypothetical protein
MNLHLVNLKNHLMVHRLKDFLISTRFYHRDLDEPRVRTMCKVYLEITKEDVETIEYFYVFGVSRIVFHSRLM